MGCALLPQNDSGALSSQDMEISFSSFGVMSEILTSSFHTSSPRDAVMISRTFTDANAIIDISTSLPRSPDEPTYLRPSPPYVRSHVDRKYV